MRRVSFNPFDLSGVQLDWFTAWKVRADAATSRIVSDHLAGRSLTFSTAVWADMKVWLLEHVFGGKCAYCEGRFLAHTPGAAEHYRPKGRVTIKLADKLKPVRGVNADPHRGYFWLAYNWRNIVPACDQCNSGSGKGDQFEVSRTRVVDPSDLSDAQDITALNLKEDPLHLHPYDDEPRDHLVFGRHGVVGARGSSRKGRYTIDTCRLNREALIEERRQMQENLKTAVLQAVVATSLGVVPSLDDALDDVYARYLDVESASYTACAQETLPLILELLSPSAEWLQRNQLT